MKEKSKSTKITLGIRLGVKDGTKWAKIKLRSAPVIDNIRYRLPNLEEQFTLNEFRSKESTVIENGHYTLYIVNADSGLESPFTPLFEWPSDLNEPTIRDTVKLYDISKNLKEIGILE